MIREEKKLLRKEILSRRDALTEAELLPRCGLSAMKIYSPGSVGVTPVGKAPDMPEESPLQQWTAFVWRNRSHHSLLRYSVDVRSKIVYYADNP